MIRTSAASPQDHSFAPFRVSKADSNSDIKGVMKGRGRGTTQATAPFFFARS